MRLTKLGLAPLFAFLLIISACSSDDDSSSDVTAEAVDTDSAALLKECEERDSAESEGTDDTDDTESALEEVTERGEPTVEPIADAPEGIESEVLIEGDGAEVPATGTVMVHYVVAAASTGEADESSWDAGSPVPLSMDTIPPSISEPLIGAKVGSRVQVVGPVEEIVGENLPPEASYSQGDHVVLVLDIVSLGTDGAGEPEVDQAALEAADERGEPEVEVPESPPDDLVIIDEVEGEDIVVCPGDSVIAHYTGVGMSSGEVFDSSWERGEPSSFSLDQVIPGWTEGLPGMYVGGRRTLVIPADMAYGEISSSGDIEPGEDLVFTVDMVGAG